MATFRSKKWGKRAFYCQECGYEFRKAWIEPMFMIRDFIRQDHAWYHNAATDENHPLVKGWIEWERERVIKLLEPLAEHDEMCYDQGKVNCYFEDCHASDYKYAIELIKGEPK